MKIIKSILIATGILLSASSLAAPQNAPAKAANKAQNNPEAQLAAFTREVKLHYLGHSVSENSEKQQVIQVQYEITNLGQKAISSLAWNALYFVNDKLILNTPVHINLLPALNSKQHLKFSLNYPLIKANNAELNLLRQSQVGARIIFHARRVTYADGKVVNFY